MKENKVRPRQQRGTTGFNSYLQSIRMILQPLVLAAPAVFLWHFLYTRGWHSTALADEPVVNAILPALASIHVFIAGFMFFKETGDIRDLRNAVSNNQKERFFEIADDKIPAPMKYVLFVSANLIVGWTISLNYEWYWTGFAAVYSVGYMLALIWEIISDFDDPVNGVWVVKDVPDEWVREANIKRRISDRLFDRLFK